MFVCVNGERLFFDIEGAGLVPDGAVMRSKPGLVLLHGGPGFDHTVFDTWGYSGRDRPVYFHTRFDLPTRRRSDADSQHGPRRVRRTPADQVFS
jgi:hypothetical protein